VVTAAGKTPRIVVRVPPGASGKHERELGAFARYCAQRIEKDMGERERWIIEISMAKQGYLTLVQVEHFGLVVEARGEGGDGPLAIWDAMCRLEQDLRERRGGRILKT
jgi:hypothetical protein